MLAGGVGMIWSRKFTFAVSFKTKALEFDRLEIILAGGVKDTLKVWGFSISNYVYIGNKSAE